MATHCFGVSRPDGIFERSYCRVTSNGWRAAARRRPVFAIRTMISTRNARAIEPFHIDVLLRLSWFITMSPDAGSVGNSVRMAQRLQLALHDF